MRRGSFGPGRDVTVVALSRLVHEASRRADELAADGIDVEVIDPRTLVPLDLDTILESVARTHRLIVVHEAVRVRRLRRRDRGARLRGGVRPARRADRADGRAAFAPIPFSPPLEDEYLRNKDDIAYVVRSML